MQLRLDDSHIFIIKQTRPVEEIQKLETYCIYTSTRTAALTITKNTHVHRGQKCNN